MTIRELLYQKKYLNQVIHATLNPNGPGAVQIHMIPPKFSPIRPLPSLLVLNGQKILPLNLSWAILFSCFLSEVSECSQGELSPEKLKEITDRAIVNARSVYRQSTYEELRNDLELITRTLCDVAYGKTPRTKIGKISTKDFMAYTKIPFNLELKMETLSDTWGLLFQKCREIGVPQLTFDCEEPSIMSSLPQLIQDASWFYTSLKTNSVALSEDDCYALRLASLDDCQLTLYSNEKAIHNHLNGFDNYDTTVNNITNILSEKIHTTVHTSLCLQNREYLRTLMFLHQLGVEYVSCSIMNPSTQNELTPETLYELLDTATDYCYANKMEISFTSPGVFTDAQMKALGFVNAPMDTVLSPIRLFADGSLFLTDSAAKEDLPLGNLFTQTWDTIWEGSALKELSR